MAEVAPALAHEIKNPLTPIRLSAERAAPQDSESGAAAPGSRPGPPLTTTSAGESLKGWATSSRSSRAAPPRRGAHRACSLLQRRVIYNAVRIGGVPEALRPEPSTRCGAIPTDEERDEQPERHAIEAMAAGHDRDRDRRDASKSLLITSGGRPGPGIPPPARQVIPAPTSTNRRGRVWPCDMCGASSPPAAAALTVNRQRPTGRGFIIELLPMASILVL